MIAPVSVDVQILLAEAFLAVTHLLGNRTRGGVFGANVQLHPVQAQHVEGVIGRHRHTHRGDAPAGELLIDPITDVGAAQRAVRDSAHRYLPHQPAAKLRCPRQHSTFARFSPKPSGHRVEARRNLSGANSFVGNRRVPGAEPGLIASSNFLPGPSVTGLQGTQPNVTLIQGRRHVRPPRHS